MTRAEIINKLSRMKRDGAIDCWKEVKGPSGYAQFFVRADNEPKWHLYYSEEDL